MEHDELEVIKRKLETSMNRKELSDYLGLSEPSVTKLWNTGKLKRFTYRGKPLSSREHVAEYLSKTIEGGYETKESI